MDVPKQHRDRYTFVLVHGAWHDGPAWERVAWRLRQLGHTVHTPTIAGHGTGADKTTTHAEGVTSLVEYITSRNLREVVLTGHSFGGTFIAKAAEQIPDRLRRLVFHNAFVLEDGSSVMDESPPDMRRLIRRLAGQDSGVLLPFPMWRELFMNDADHDLAQTTYHRLSPQPVGMIETPLDLRRFYELLGAGRLRCSYLNATDDFTMPAGPYAWHPRFSARLGLCRIVQMPGGHEVLFTNPAGLATKLVEAGRD